MEASAYLLDTNIASHIIKGDLPSVRARLVQVPIQAVVISVVTEAELLYGVARRGHPRDLSLRVNEFLARVEVLPWTSEEAQTYAELRSQCESQGVPLSPMDMLIAAQARALERSRQALGARSILVTRDRSFTRVPGGLSLEDWAQAA